MFPYQKIIATPIIFNNTGYLILMLGAVGYSPVVSPHRIKQVCQPYQVVKVATGGVEICWLARPMRFGVVAKLL